ncbi:MAG: circularly permuted type 2 ATP-grasp protein [Acidimicrobiales bacterium]
MTTADHFTTAAAMGFDELDQRRDEIRRLLRDDGVTYTVYGESPAGGQWQLDPIPVTMAGAEWAEIEQGVMQRSELLDLILDDLYGPRRLIESGLLPPEVIFGHRGFLRSCDQVRLPGAHQLITCAIDLARDPEGRWVVLSDRAQAPSGVGYALENRSIISRVFPSLYREGQVHRLAPFFRALRSSLNSVAPAAVDDPHIVVLSPGMLSETYFEHAYLASYLGYSLVEGQDLVVRDGRVWLRSLGDLQPVDVILRRVDSLSCDPLELVADSRLGVPGLVEATRLGSVSVVNPLGSGVLENPGLWPFLPDIAEHLLGRSLQLSTPRTWWCGNKMGRSHVLAKIDELVIKPIDRESGVPSLFGHALTSVQREELSRKIEARPYAYVGQEIVSVASFPTLGDQGVEDRATVLRCFAVAGEGSYVVMPGGLARVAASPDTFHISNQAGASSKDVWVVASEPESLNGWMNRGTRTSVPNIAGAVSPRAAENLFWFGRYLDRAENVVRLLRVVHECQNDFQSNQEGVVSNPAGIECLHLLLIALTQVTGTFPGFTGEGAQARLAAPDEELLALVLSEQRVGSPAYACAKARDAAFAVRDQMSNDTWMLLSDLDATFAILARQQHGGHAALSTAFARLLQGLLALSGLASESLVRDTGWRFMDAGRRLERSQHLVSLVGATMATERRSATESLMIESILNASESSVTYRRRYRSRAQLETMLDLLFLDVSNPRSLAFQLARLSENVDAFSESPPHELDQVQRLVLEASTTLRLSDSAALASSQGPGTDRKELDGLVLHLGSLLSATSSALESAHFSHRLPQHTFADLGDTLTMPGL